MEELGGERIVQAYLDIKNPYRAKLPPGKFSDPTYEEPILRKARAGGYDGVIIENDTTDPLAAETFYVVFNNKQIKSATDNLGTFDGSNPDIRFSLDDGESEAERWSEAMECDGYAVFDQDGRLLEVCLSVALPDNTVMVELTDFPYDDCVVLYGDAEISVCDGVEYCLYQYAYGSAATLKAEAVINGLCFDFRLDTTPDAVEQAKLDFQAVLECFASYPDGKPDLSAIVPAQIPELLEQTFETLEEASNEPDFGRVSALGASRWVCGVVCSSFPVR